MSSETADTEVLLPTRLSEVAGDVPPLGTLCRHHVALGGPRVWGRTSPPMTEGRGSSPRPFYTQGCGTTLVPTDRSPSSEPKRLREKSRNYTPISGSGRTHDPIYIHTYSLIEVKTKSYVHTGVVP